jgi:hypothetical protein
MWGIAASILVASVALGAGEYYWSTWKQKKGAPGGDAKAIFLPKQTADSIRKGLSHVKKVAPRK